MSIQRIELLKYAFKGLSSQLGHPPAEMVIQTLEGATGKTFVPQLRGWIQGATYIGTGPIAQRARRLALLDMAPQADLPEPETEALSPRRLPKVEIPTPSAPPWKPEKDEDVIQKKPLSQHLQELKEKTTKADSRNLYMLYRNEFFIPRPNCFN